MFGDGPQLDRGVGEGGRHLPQEGPQLF
jgi:hypothetical protein